jgi:Uma2 family endonuclease
LNAWLVTAFSGHAWVRAQNPVVLDDGSEPRPDFSLLRPHWDGYLEEHPRPADIFLLIEVSDTSLAFDRGPNTNRANH